MVILLFDEEVWRAKLMIAFLHYRPTVELAIGGQFDKANWQLEQENSEAYRAKLRINNHKIKNQSYGNLYPNDKQNGWLFCLTQ